MGQVEWGSDLKRLAGSNTYRFYALRARPPIGHSSRASGRVTWRRSRRLSHLVVSLGLVVATWAAPERRHSDQTSDPNSLPFHVVAPARVQLKRNKIDRSILSVWPRDKTGDKSGVGVTKSGSIDGRARRASVLSALIGVNLAGQSGDFQGPSSWLINWLCLYPSSCWSAFFTFAWLTVERVVKCRRVVSLSS